MANEINGGSLSPVTVTAKSNSRQVPVFPGVTSSDMLSLKSPISGPDLSTMTFKKAKTAGFTGTRAQWKGAGGQSTKAGKAVDKVVRSLSSDKTTSGSGLLGGIKGDVAGAALDMVSGMIPDKGKNTSFKEQQQIGNVLMKINPMIGAIYKVGSIVGELTGTNVSKMNKDQAKAAGVGGAARTLNNFSSYLPGAGILGNTRDAEKSHLIDEMSSAYGGTVSDMNMAGTMSGQNYLFGKGKANRFIKDMNEKNRLLTDINQTNTLRKQSDYGMDIAQQNLNRYAGTNYIDVHLGKNGMKFAELDEVRWMLANRKQKQEVEKFANGGVIDGENILPQGQLHARLHHMDKSDPELAARLTRKGIPVVALTEGGEIEQVAEIEHSEWTLSKSLTDKLEELRKDGSEEAMIEAGKIIVEELLFNTKDEGGLINE